MVWKQTNRKKKSIAFYSKANRAKETANRLAIAESQTAEASEFASARLLQCGEIARDRLDRLALNSLRVRL